ncbi:MAG TPA: UvrD-helicase domain-containing protein [Candidatus Babeliales bacterium]|nr:UvrD-helicase domain-containing protein [Candidatus Babeliales bacterium]
MHESTIDFDNFIKNNLNKEQKAAVEHDNGTLLVIAGAGSGKTRIITTRITHLILNKHTDPRSIIALTFTNKAAREMSERIELFLKNTGIPTPIIGTFHSYCLRLLKRFDHLHEIPNFSIMDDDDQIKLISTIVDKISNPGHKISARDLIFQISQYKNAHAVGQEHITPYELLPDIVRMYDREKKQSKCYDFDDLLLQVLKLFQTNQEFKKKFQQEIAHILVDEYQDTNHVQHTLLKEMALQNKKLAITSVCAVGDEDQSIYSWRGATIDNILQFKRDFEKTTSITIEQNYRSVQSILDIANNVINNNSERNPKNLWSAKTGKNRIALIKALSSYQESDLIAQAIAIAQKKYPKNPIAILYRTHYQSRVIEEALIRASIAYRIIGGIQFYDRKEIKDIIAYLRLAINPYDRISWTRVINCPARGLGDKFQEVFQEVWEREPLLNHLQISKKIIHENLIVKSKNESLSALISLFEHISEVDTPSKIIEKILLNIEYIPYLKRSYQQREAEEKVENIREFIRAIAHFEQIGITNIRSLLEEITLMQEKTAHTSDEEERNTQVQLMTLHAAKGLEFAFVAISGLEEGLLPSSRARFDSKQLEEERRLFYVGITRAQEYLLLTHSTVRASYGNMTDQIRSRFLDEIPKKLYQEENGLRWQQYQSKQFFSQWLGITNNETPSSVFTFGSAFKANDTLKATNLPKQINKIKPKEFYRSGADKTTNSKKYTKSNTEFFGQFSKKTSTQKRESLSREKVEASIPNPGTIAWRTNQPVTHSKFGVGIVKKIDHRTDGEAILTIEFKSGTKKINAAFVTKT